MNSELRKAYRNGKLVSRQIRSDANQMCGEWIPAIRHFGDAGCFKSGSYWSAKELGNGNYQMSMAAASFELHIEN